MTWAKLDDRFHENRKVRALWQAHPAALGLHMLALTYCAGNETDGVVDVVFVSEKTQKPAQRRRMTDALVACGLWREHPDGWEINDFLVYNPSRSENEAARGVDRFRKDLTRDHALIEAIKERDGNRCRYCGVVVNWSDRRSKTGGTYDHVVPVSAQGDNSFANVVVACRGCNGRKGARTPEQARMPLLVLPGPTPDLPAGLGPGLVASRPVPTRPVPDLPRNSFCEAGLALEVSGADRSFAVCVPRGETASSKGRAA